MNQVINPVPLKHLKDLLIEGNNGKILNYVRGEFSTNLDTYINLSQQVSQTQIECLEMQKKGLERQKKLEDLIKEINSEER